MCSGTDVVAVSVVLPYDVIVQQKRDILELGPLREVFTSLVDVLVECITVPRACKEVRDRCPEHNAKPEPVGQQCRSGHVDDDDQVSRSRAPCH